MMESIPLDDSPDEDANTSWVLDVGFDVPQTPSSASEDGGNHHIPGRVQSDDESDEEAEAEAHGELVPRVKPGGYDSRVEQMLYENPELPILIIDAGKSSESGGRYIVYTIKTGV